MDVSMMPPDADQRVRRIWEYWCSLRPAPGRFPARRHFEPSAVPDLLPWLWLLDVERAPLRFRCRLVGTGHRDMMGREFTGRWADEVFPRFAETRAHVDFVAAAAGEPRWFRGVPDFAPATEYAGTERLVLPLAADGARIDLLLGVTLYRRDSGSLA